MAEERLIVWKGRTNTVQVAIGENVSEDTITSEIREAADPESDLIATWTVTFETDGVDGEIILTLDNTITTAITQSVGFMDLKRITSGEPVNVFAEPLEVLFRKPVTV